MSFVFREKEANKTLQIYFLFVTKFCQRDYEFGHVRGRPYCEGVVITSQVTCNSNDYSKLMYTRTLIEISKIRIEGNN